MYFVFLLFCLGHLDFSLMPDNEIKNIEIKFSLMKRTIFRYEISCDHSAHKQTSNLSGMNLIEQNPFLQHSFVSAEYQIIGQRLTHRCSTNSHKPVWHIFFFRKNDFKWFRESIRYFYTYLHFSTTCLLLIFSLSFFLSSRLLFLCSYLENSREKMWGFTVALMSCVCVCWLQSVLVYMKSPWWYHFFLCSVSLSSSHVLRCLDSQGLLGGLSLSSLSIPLSVSVSLPVAPSPFSLFTPPLPHFSLSAIFPIPHSASFFSFSPRSVSIQSPFLFFFISIYLYLSIRATYCSINDQFIILSPHNSFSLFTP